MARGRLSRGDSRRPWTHTVSRLADQCSRVACAADLLVCPSRHEPLRNVVIEAWAHDTPVLQPILMAPAISFATARQAFWFRLMTQMPLHER